jgi:DNA helicase-2/ATP-dependent DNA helicase PcrA
MARTLAEEIVDPHGVACITYNNECASELKVRLAALGIRSNGRGFIGTVHGFALTHIILPYARCIPGLLPENFRVATFAEKQTTVETAYRDVFGNDRDLRRQWDLAEKKRRRDLDRSLPSWREPDPRLAAFVESYEARLRRQSLIDFEDMPLIALRMVRDHHWIRVALRARFPVLFIDEYQDLGHALHELVLLLCFDAGIRLFAVGDADQSIYGFAGASPRLLHELTEREEVHTVRLRFNYRSGTKIIRASLNALGEERDYRGRAAAPEGTLAYWPVKGDHVLQAGQIVDGVLPSLFRRGFRPEQIAVLYRTASLGDTVAEALKRVGTAFVRADNNALVKRSSLFARFIESCAVWVTAGWRTANPSYTQLLNQALGLVYENRAGETEKELLSRQLIAFLHGSIDGGETTHAWLLRFQYELVASWKLVARKVHQEWDVCAEMVERTSPAKGQDMPLAVFAGSTTESGRVNLSTLHSAKGREFDAVIMFGMNDYDISGKYEIGNDVALRDARRLFYVGVTRPRRELCFVYEAGHQSPWVTELYWRRTQS